MASCIRFRLLDGRIARKYNITSNAGAGVDATADVFSLVAVGFLCVFSAVSTQASNMVSEHMAWVLALLAAGLIGKSGAPLWTVADRFGQSGVERNTDRAEPGQREIPGIQVAKFCFVNLTDHSFFLSLAAVSIWMKSDVGWLLLALYTAIVGAILTVASFLSMARQDGYR